jgi:AcrR family transcriptional regulator
MVRDRASSKRREEILQAALACFLGQGYGPTTVEDIRARSGASIGSIYYHFESKERLAAALYLQSLRHYSDGFLRELTRHGDARAGVEGAVRYHLWWISEHRDRALYLFHMREVEAVSATVDEIREVRRDFYRTINDWMAPQIEAGTIRRLPADLYTAVWFGPAHEFERLWLAGRARTSIERAQALLAAAAWVAVGAPSNGTERGAEGPPSCDN